MPWLLCSAMTRNVEIIFILVFCFDNRKHVDFREALPNCLKATRGLRCSMCFMFPCTMHNSTGHTVVVGIKCTHFLPIMLKNLHMPPAEQLCFEQMFVNIKLVHRFAMYRQIGQSWSLALRDDTVHMTACWHARLLHMLLKEILQIGL